MVRLPPQHPRRAAPSLPLLQKYLRNYTRNHWPPLFCHHHIVRLPKGPGKLRKDVAKSSYSGRMRETSLDAPIVAGVVVLAAAIPFVVSVVNASTTTSAVHVPCPPWTPTLPSQYWLVTLSSVATPPAVPLPVISPQRFRLQFKFSFLLTPTKSCAANALETHALETHD